MNATEPLRMTLRCQNPDCRESVGKAHLLGPGVVEAAPCKVCGGVSEFSWTEGGVVARYLGLKSRAKAAVQKGT